MDILNNIPNYALYIGVFAICFALAQTKKVKAVKVDNKKMEEIAGHIRAVSYTHLTLPTILLV